MRTLNEPLYCLVPRGSGIVSPFFAMSARTPRTTFLIPRNASSSDFASQERLGISAQRPTYSPSCSDQNIRYVYFSARLILVSLSLFPAGPRGDQSRPRVTQLGSTAEEGPGCGVDCEAKRKGPPGNSCACRTRRLRAQEPPPPPSSLPAHPDAVEP